MNIVLYSNGCPRCRVLKQRLDTNSIPYTEENSVDEMLKIGMTQAPALLVDGVLLDYSKAIAYINQLGGSNEKQ